VISMSVIEAGTNAIQHATSPREPGRDIDFHVRRPLEVSVQDSDRVDPGKVTAMHGTSIFELVAVAFHHAQLHDSVDSSFRARAPLHLVKRLPQTQAAAG